MSEEKKSFIKLIILIFFVIIIILNINFPKTKEITLDEIKEKIKETKKIDVYMNSERLRTIDDEEIVKEVIDITISLGEASSDATFNKVGDNYKLYFKDKNNKILARAEFYNHYVFIVGNKNYRMEYSSMKELRELLGFDPLD